MRMVHFKPFDRSENWEQAKAHCRKERLELAQIDTRVVLNSAKAKFLRPPSTKEFWTGLQYVNNRLEWSNGKEAFCNATLSEVIHCADLGNFTHQYCFLMTANQEKLKPSRCDIAHRFICQRGELCLKVCCLFLVAGICPGHFILYQLPLQLCDPNSLLAPNDEH